MCTAIGRGVYLYLLLWLPIGSYRMLYQRWATQCWNSSEFGLIQKVYVILFIPVFLHVPGGWHIFSEIPDLGVLVLVRFLAYVSNVVVIRTLIYQ